MTSMQEMSPWRAWVLAARPKTLPAAIAPVSAIFNLLSSSGVLACLPALAALVGALLIQIGANLANDYFDYVKGTDVAGRKGPTRVAQSGLLPLVHLRVGIVVTFGLASLVGVYLALVGGWPILVIGLASLLAALAYTGGPFPIGYHGLGDVFVFLFFGLVAVCGTYYVQALALPLRVVAAAIPVGTLTTAILIVNNLRDLETDRQTGKRTLAVRLGERATRLEYALALALAYLTLPLFWLLGWSSAWVLLPWLTLPLAGGLVRTVFRTNEGPPLNKALAGTANLGLAFSLLFSLGLIL